MEEDTELNREVDNLGGDIFRKVLICNISLIKFMNQFKLFTYR